MYNLFVSADENAWTGDPFVITRSRCVSKGEYTDANVADRFAELSSSQVRELCSLPCVFAYELGCGKDPKFGVLQDVKRRTGGQLQIEYRVIPCDPFATIDDIQSLGVLLDIGGWELGRTHWAVKDVDLAVELGRRGILLPGWTTGTRGTVDIRRHRFEVAPIVSRRTQELCGAGGGRTGAAAWIACLLLRPILRGTTRAPQPRCAPAGDIRRTFGPRRGVHLPRVRREGVVRNRVAEDTGTEGHPRRTGDHVCAAG